MSSVPALSAYLFLGMTARDVVYVLFTFSAASFSALAAVRAQGWRRRLWTLFAVGLGFFFAADTLASWYEIDSGEIPFPSVADAIYFAGYCCFAAGWLLVALRRRHLWRSQMLDSAMVAAALAYCGWLFLIEPSSGGLDLESLAAVSYPVMDVVLVSLLVWLALGSRFEGSARWLLGSLGLLLGTDLVYAQVQVSSGYASGALDLGWMISYVCWGVAALHPGARNILGDKREVGRNSGIRVVAPAIAFLVVPVSLVAQTLILGEAEPFDIAFGGLLLGMLATARVVHLVRSEHAYREKAERSERHYRSLIENSADVFTIVDAENAITYVSPSVQTLLGVEVETMIGSPGLERIHPDDLPAVERGLAALLTGEEDVARFEARVRCEDGSYVRVEATGTNRLDDPAVRGIVMCGRGLTERDAAEAERRRLEQELNQSQKMDAIGRLAGGVAHDFNNLLMVISAAAESILHELPDDEQAIRGKVRQTRTAVDRAATLTQQLLTFSRREQPSLRVIDLNEQVSATCGMLRRIIGEEVRVELDLDTKVPLIRADASQIDQVLFNLAVNARDAMPEGGTLSFATRADGDHVTLVVSDTGVGMDEDTQAHIFEPFFTTKAPGEGTGLGLATVYGVVSQIGGAVHVDTALGVGTAFTIVLPSADGAPTVVLSELGQRPESGGETVLLVEDEEIVRSVVREGLEQYGYRVFDTGDPREASALARLHRADLLVTDIRMPHMGGFELFDELRQIRPDLKTVFMSGYSETAYSSLDHDGSTRFLQKPFGIADLAVHVRSLLDGPDTPLAASAA